MATTLAEIVSKIASQGKNPDVSFLKDNPEAQTMLLMALLANANNNNNNNGAVQIDNDKRKYDSVNSASSSPSPPRDEPEGPRRVGRKPVTSDDEDSDNPKLKRKAQNRAAQRAFRERKENHVRILEDRVKELENMNLDKNTALVLENEQLKNMISKLQDENAALLGSSSSFDIPLSASDTNRPTKLIRSYNEPAYFSSATSSNSNTPETQHQPISIDDILGLDTSVLPSHALLDHSELLGFNNNDYTGQLNDMLTEHRLTFTDNPDLDFFYPLNDQFIETNPIPIKKDKDGDKYIKDITQVWDKVAEYPRFDEVDMDLLCEEMKKKAVCSDFEHDKELEKVLNEHYPI